MVVIKCIYNCTLFLKKKKKISLFRYYEIETRKGKYKMQRNNDEVFTKIQTPISFK